MEITKEMIEAYKTRFPDISDEGAEGSLAMWANGQGELDAELVNGNPVLAPIAEAYYKAHGQEVPESVEVPLTPVDEGTTDIMEEVPVDAKGEPTGNVEVEPDKLPEAEPTAE